MSDKTVLRVLVFAIHSLLREMAAQKSHYESKKSRPFDDEEFTTQQEHNSYYEAKVMAYTHIVRLLIELKEAITNG